MSISAELPSGAASWCELMAGLPAGDMDVLAGLRGLDPDSLSASDAVAALAQSYTDATTGRQRVEWGRRPGWAD